MLDGCRQLWFLDLGRRFGLQDDLARLVEHLNIAIASTLLGKSVIREDHPLYVGVYGELIARDEVQQFINQSDCLLILGSILSDVEELDLSFSVLSEDRTVHATADRVAIKHHRYDALRFQDFVRALTTHPLPSFPSRPLPPPVPIERGTNVPYSPITLNRLFQHLAASWTRKCW